MRRALVLVAVGLVGIACTSQRTSSLQVRTDYSKTVSWTEMKRFRMASAASAAETDYTRYPRFERIVRDAVEQELIERRYRRVEDGPSDFRVAVELIFRGGTGPGPGDSPYGSEAVPASVEGAGQTSSLIVRMLEPDTSEVLWEGRVSGFRVDAINPEAELRRVAWRLLVEFPPITGP